MAGTALRAKVQNLWQSPGVSDWRHRFSVNRMYRYLTADQRRLPDFIIAGAQKAGTTTLFYHLAGHPCVRPPMVKELAFFDNRFQRGLAWYRLHFPRYTEPRGDDGASQPVLTGESSSYYIFHPLVPQRVAATLPDVKIIILLRNPVDRAYSHYHHKLRRGQETLPFEAALDAEEERTAGEHERIVREPGYRSRAHRLHTYLARGRYLEQIRRWQQYFGPERLLIVESGQFFKNTADVYRRVLDFLGLPAWQPAEYKAHFAGGYRAKMSPATRNRLVEYFGPHNEQLYAHLGTRFDWDR